jgi:hypothetical protein
VTAYVAKSMGTSGWKCPRNPETCCPRNYGT